MDNNKLYVGNLSWDVDDAQLADFFEEQVGEVEEAKVISDKFSGRSKGFGFVTMNSSEDAQKAIDELNGKELDGREIKVAKALPKKSRN